MRRRLYFIVPSTHTAQTIVNELLLARIEISHMHLIAREDIELGNLPEASFLQKSDLRESAAYGLLFGALTGLICGIAAIAFLGSEKDTAALIIAAAALVGTGFGAWVSSMIGINLPNRELAKFQDAIKTGHILMMIDVPKNRVKEIDQLIVSHHTDTIFAGVEPHLPAFP